jgi:hypothetical protein
VILFTSSKGRSVASLNVCAVTGPSRLADDEFLAHLLKRAASLFRDCIHPFLERPRPDSEKMFFGAPRYLPNNMKQRIEREERIVLIQKAPSRSRRSTRCNV